MSDESELPSDDEVAPAQVEQPPPKPPNGNGEHETISDKVQSARESIPVGDRGLAPMAYEHQVTIAKDRARAYLMLPQHLHNNAAVMTALVGIAARFNLDPVMLASQTYVQNNRLCFQSQAFGAILYGSNLLIGRLRFDFNGEGEDRTCTVRGRFKDDPDTICEATTPPLREIHPGYSKKERDGVMQTFVKGSPLWDKDAEQQLVYFGQRRWIRRFAPDACMGMYTSEEIAEIDEFRVSRDGAIPLTADRLGQLNTGEGWGDGSHVTMDLAAIAPEIPDDDPEPPKPTRRAPARPIKSAKVIVRPRTAGRTKPSPAARQKPGKAHLPSKVEVAAAANRAEKGPRVVAGRNPATRWLNYVNNTEAWIKGLDEAHAAEADGVWEGEREMRDGLKVPMGERSRLRAMLDRRLTSLGMSRGDAA